MGKDKMRIVVEYQVCKQTLGMVGLVSVWMQCWQAEKREEGKDQFP